MVTIYAGNMQWCITLFIWNVEIAFFHACENLDYVEVIMLRGNIKKSLIVSASGIYVFTTE